MHTQERTQEEEQEKSKVPVKAIIDLQQQKH
jgi:hypothetical protein